MDVRTITVDGRNLSYYEVHPEISQTILFLHGNSHSNEFFRKQLEDQRFKNFRLIAIDLPGHGESSCLEEYSLIHFAGVIQKLIEALEVKQFIVVGHSLGGHIGLQLIKQASPNGILIFGTPPLPMPFSDQCFLPNENAAPLWQESSTTEQLEKLANELQYNHTNNFQLITDYLKTDSKFRTQVLQSVLEGKYLDETRLIGQYSGELMVLACEEDNIVNNKNISDLFQNFPHFDFVEFSSGHSPQIEIAEEFSEILLDFARKALPLNPFDKLSVSNERDSFFA